MKPETIASLTADVAAAREHLDRATALLEEAKRSAAPIPPSPLVVQRITVRCGTCRGFVLQEEFSAHFRVCRSAAADVTTKALRSAVMEEVAMDRLSGRQLEI